VLSNRSSFSEQSHDKQRKSEVSKVKEETPFAEQVFDLK
jgi:hypothetical protein